MYPNPPFPCLPHILETPSEGRGDRGRVERDAHERVRRALGTGHEAASIVRFQPHARKLKALLLSYLSLYFWLEGGGCCFVDH